MPIVIFQHSDLCRTGRLGATLRDHGYELEVIRVDKGEPVPPDYDNVEAVISLGGPQNVDESHPWLANEREYLKDAHERSLPVVCLCLGAEILAEALGGTVEKMEKKEVGLHEVTILPDGHTDTILTGIAWKSPQFQWHEYGITKLPDGATHLAKSELCEYQAFRAGMRTYGFQYHFEADRSMIDSFVEQSRGDLHSAGVTSEEFARQLDEQYEMFARLADRLCLNIATYLLPQAVKLASR